MNQYVQILLGSTVRSGPSSVGEPACTKTDLLGPKLTKMDHFALGGFKKAFGRRLYSGARLRGCTATQRSKKGSENVLGRVLGKGSQKGSEKGAYYGFYSKKRVLRRVLRRGFQKGVSRTPPRRVRPLRRVPYLGGGFCRRTQTPFVQLFLGDSGQILGCSSDFWSVAPTFGL